MARILIVDDDLTHRALAFQVLVGAGHEVFVAADGKSALDLFRKTPVDLVVTDMVMPRMDGLQLLKALKEEDPDLPVIAVSGVSAEKLNKSARFGAEAILVKPVDPGEFLRQVEMAL